MPGVARSSAWTPRRIRLRRTGGVGYVPGEANLWPGLTGGEALHLPGRVQGRVEEACRDELTRRFRLDPSRRARTCSTGNRQKVLVAAALSSRASHQEGTWPRPPRDGPAGC